MSVTIAHRPHTHLPWKSIGIVVGAAFVAAALLVIVNQSWEIESGTQSASTATTGGQAVVVPEPEPWSMIHARPGVDVLPAEAMATGASAANQGTRPARFLVHNRAQWTTFDGGAYVAEPAAPQSPSGTLRERHPLNFTADGSR